MRSNLTAFGLLIAALVSPAPAAAASLAATSVTVTAAIPETGDSAGIAWEKTKAGKNAETAAAEAAEAPVYIVKVYMKRPPAGPEGYELWVGDENVGEYGGFKHGLFFKVYSEEKLARWAGKPLRIGRQGQAPQDLGKDFPAGDAKREFRAADSGAGGSRKRIKDVLAD